MMLEYRKIDYKTNADTCIEIVKDSFFESFKDSSFFEKTFGIDGAKYVDWLRSFKGLMLHAWLDDKIVGEIVLDFKRAYLQHIYVIPEKRSFGIGKELHKYSLEKFREQKISKITLDVSKTNLRAIHFYLRNGWSLVGSNSNDTKLNTYQIHILLE